MKFATNERIVKEFYFSESFLPFNHELFADHLLITNLRLITESKSKRSTIRNEIPLSMIRGVSGSYFKKYVWNVFKIIFLLLSLGLLGYTAFVALTSSALIVHDFIYEISGYFIDAVFLASAVVVFFLSFFFKNKKGTVYELKILHDPLGSTVISHYAKSDEDLNKIVMKVYKTGHDMLENLGTIILDLQKEPQSVISPTTTKVDDLKNNKK